MCEEYVACGCLRQTPRKPKKFNFLLLDCWQREYDKRPYRNFRFRVVDFEERMGRRFHALRDFRVLVDFLNERRQWTVQISGLRVSPFYSEDLVESLVRVRRVTLQLIELPPHFFEHLRCNVSRMLMSELSLEGTPLTTADLKLLRSYLLDSRILRSLNVSHCGIDQYNFAVVADGVYKSTSLRCFKCSHLVGNKLSLDTEKIAHTVSSLVWQRKIQEIHMEQCEFTAHDMATIAEYLADSRTRVFKLNFSCNIIASDGAEHLFRAVVVSRQLRYLDISKNGLGTHGGDVVAKYLSSCTHLRYLDISHNEIGVSAINNILLMMKKPFMLKTLKLWGNKFDDRSANIIWRLLDAEVVRQEGIDVTVTFDDTIDNRRVIPWQ